MPSIEPTLKEIDDYEGKESKKKKWTIVFIVTAGLAIAVIFGLMNTNPDKPSALEIKEKTGIFKR